MRELFQSYGIIESCRVLRNARSQGYGFVKFSLHHEALAAIDSMNGQLVDPTLGPLEVKFANTDPGSRQQPQQLTPNDNLYIRNLPSDFTEEELGALFVIYGGVKECRVLAPLSNPGQPIAGRTCGGLVRLVDPNAALAAIEQLNSAPPLPGSTAPLLVRFADTPEDKLRKAASKDSFRLASGPSIRPAVQSRASWSTGGAATLPPGFMAFSSPAMPLDPNRAAGYPRSQQQQVPSAMVQYPAQSPYYAQEAMQRLMLSAQENGGHSYQLPQIVLATSLYLKNLPPEADRLYLYELFAPLGAVQSVRVLQHEGGQCRGVGFINYGDHTSAVAAIQALDGAPVSGGRILHVSLQPPRDRSKRAI